MRQRLSAVLIGTIATLLVFEIGLRVAGLVLSGDKHSGSEDADITILCEGDSFTYGIGGRSFPRQVQEILNERPDTPTVEAINEGLPGLNTALLADQLPGHLDQYDPDIVLIIIGENNSWNTVRVTPTDGALPLSVRVDQVLLEYSRVYKFVKVALVGVDQNTFHEAAAANMLNPAQQAANYMTETEETIGYSNEDEQPSALPPLAHRKRWRELRTYVDEGRYDEGIEAYRAFTQDVPDYADGWYELAACYMREKRLPEAVEALETARTLEGATDETWFSLGHAYANQGLIDEAVDVWRDGLVKWPKSRRIYTSLATTLFDHRSIWDTLAAVEGIDGIEENLLHQYLLQVREAAPDTEVENMVLDATRDDIRRIIRAVHARDIEVVFGSYPDNGFPEIEQTVRAEGARYINFVPYFDERFESREDYLSSDRCHCTTVGYRLMAEIFVEEVVEVLGL